jgi:hypothetical protein
MPARRRSTREGCGWFAAPDGYLMPTSSTSKMMIEFGGTLPTSAAP